MKKLYLTLACCLYVSLAFAKECTIVSGNSINMWGSANVPDPSNETRCWEINFNTDKPIRITGQYDLEITQALDMLRIYEEGATINNGLNQTFSVGAGEINLQTSLCEGRVFVEYSCFCGNQYGDMGFILNFSVNEDVDVMESLYINGNVGIGTTSPKAKLHVMGDIRGGEPDGSIKIRTTNGYVTIGALSSSANFSTNRDYYSYDKRIINSEGIYASYLRHNLQLYTFDTPRLTILHTNGNVGIGTETPQEKLHIGGAVRGNGTGGALTISTEYGTLTLGPQDANTALFSTNKESFRFNQRVDFAGGLYLPAANINESWFRSYLQWQGHSLVMGSPAGAYNHNSIDLLPGGVDVDTLFSQIRMYTATGLNRQELRIQLNTTSNCWFNNTGNFGIGTSHPQYKLDVNGTIRAKEILVNLDGGADFVFEEDYRLRPLNEVKSFIQENGHLPEIQSAADMQENGVSITDLQIQLLQKIEELTLYLIQQEQTIQELRTELQQLK